MPTSLLICWYGKANRRTVHLGWLTGLAKHVIWAYSLLVNVTGIQSAYDTKCKTSKSHPGLPYNPPHRHIGLFFTFLDNPFLNVLCSGYHMARGLPRPYFWSFSSLFSMSELVIACLDLRMFIMLWFPIHPSFSEISFTYGIYTETFLFWNYSIPCYLPLTKPDLRCLDSYSHTDIGSPVTKVSFNRSNRVGMETGPVSESCVVLYF
jgi:hypothetical protein